MLLRHRQALSGTSCSSGGNTRWCSGLRTKFQTTADYKYFRLKTGENGERQQICGLACTSASLRPRWDSLKHRPSRDVAGPRLKFTTMIQWFSDAVRVTLQQLIKHHLSIYFSASSWTLFFSAASVNLCFPWEQTSVKLKPHIMFVLRSWKSLGMEKPSRSQRRSAESEGEESPGGSAPPPASRQLTGREWIFIALFLQ